MVGPDLKSQQQPQPSFQHIPQSLDPGDKHRVQPGGRFPTLSDGDKQGQTQGDESERQSYQLYRIRPKTAQDQPDPYTSRRQLHLALVN